MLTRLKLADKGSKAQKEQLQSADWQRTAVNWRKGESKESVPTVTQIINSIISVTPGVKATMLFTALGF